MRIGPQLITLSFGIVIKLLGVDEASGRSVDGEAKGLHLGHQMCRRKVRRYLWRPKRNRDKSHKKKKKKEIKNERNPKQFS